MANFGDAFKKLSIKEGGYVNDKDDAGGETYRGISRKYNPTWQGWNMIDQYKKHYTVGSKEFKSKLDNDIQLQKLVWSKYKLERIKYYNDIAGKGNNIKYLRGWIRRTLDE